MNYVKKSWFKRWRVVFILVVIAGGIIWAGFEYSEYGILRRARISDEKLQEEYEQMLREDTYGGETPEETFDLFIVALEAGNTELASKYFVLEKQEEWEEKLEDYKIRGLLNDYAVEWKKIKSEWIKNETEDIIYFKYINKVEEDTSTIFNNQEIKIPAGEYTNNAEFTIYPSRVWKIRVL